MARPSSWAGRSCRRLTRLICLLATAAVLIVRSAAAPAVAQPPFGGPILPNQVFGGLVNGSTGNPTPGTIRMGCFGRSVPDRPAILSPARRWRSSCRRPSWVPSAARALPQTPSRLSSALLRRRLPPRASFPQLRRHNGHPDLAGAAVLRGRSGDLRPHAAEPDVPGGGRARPLRRSAPAAPPDPGAEHPAALRCWSPTACRRSGSTAESRSHSRRRPFPDNPAGKSMFATLS